MAARIATGLLLAGVIILAPLEAVAADSDQPFVKHALVLSADATLAHFGPRLNDAGRGLQAWNLSARAAILPFGVTRFATLRGFADGALEVGLEPTFERFTSENQNSPSAKKRVEMMLRPKITAQNTTHQIQTGTCGNQYCMQNPAAVKLDPSATVHVSQ